MLDTIGKKLTQARQAQGLSIEEAAHATRIRPDKLIALEHNDYSRFGSNAYAKGFLQIYGKFLGVDVTEIARTLETPRQVSISDYQYLNSAPDEPPARQQRHQPRASRSLHAPRQSVIPLVLMVVAMLIAVGSLMAYWINVTNQRLESSGAGKTAATASQPAANTTPPEGTEAPTPAAPATAQANATAQPGSTETPAAAPGDAPVEVRRAEPVLQPFAPVPGSPADASNPSPATAVVATPAGVNEVVVEPLKKTWVKIRKDSPTSPPIFEDFLYPGARPLVLRGTKFFVEVRDQDAVQIRKNGSPIAYQAPGISIQ